MLQNREEVLKNLKIKALTKEQILISIDRLTRFKHTEVKYLRVFFDILTNNLISPKFRKSELERMNYSEITALAEYVFNHSLKSLGADLDDDLLINQRLYDYENSVFKLDDNTQLLLKNKFNYKAAIKFIEGEDIPINLKWLKMLLHAVDIKNERENQALLFPLEKIVICEGITEETLLPVFADVLEYDFKRKGVYVLSAGGKNQVVKTFYKLVEMLKLPIFVLLDNDAGDNYNEILPKLREIDKIHILKSGEFEDTLPLHLIEKTLNYATKNISLAPVENIANASSRVEYLEDFFKHRGLHEFKKAEFANMVKLNISGIDDVSDEIKDVIEELKNLRVTN